MHEFSPQTTHKKPKNIGKPLATTVIAVVALGGSFFGGMQFQKSKTPVVSSMNGQMQFGTNGSMPGGGRMMMHGGIFGEVTAISSTSITVKADSGTTTTLTINDSTSILDGGETATVDKIQTGDRVMVVKDSSDSSIAKRIDINPVMNGPQSNSQGTSDQSTGTDTPTTYTN